MCIAKQLPLSRVGLALGLFVLALAGPAAAQGEDGNGYGYIRVLEGQATLMQAGSGDRDGRDQRASLLAATADRAEPVAGRDRPGRPQPAAHRRRQRGGPGASGRVAGLARPRHGAAPPRRQSAVVVVHDSLGDELPRIDTPNATIYVQDYGIYRVTADRDGWTELVVRNGRAEVVTDRGSERGARRRAGGESRGRVASIDVRPAGAYDTLERWAGRLDDGGRRGQPATSTTTCATARRRSPATAPGSQRGPRLLAAAGGRGLAPLLARAAGPTRRAASPGSPTSPGAGCPTTTGAGTTSPPTAGSGRRATGWAPAWVYWYRGPSYTRLVPDRLLHPLLRLALATASASTPASTAGPAATGGPLATTGTSWAMITSGGATRIATRCRPTTCATRAEAVRCRAASSPPTPADHPGEVEERGRGDRGRCARRPGRVDGEARAAGRDAVHRPQARAAGYGRTHGARRKAAPRHAAPDRRSAGRPRSGLPRRRRRGQRKAPAAGADPDEGPQEVPGVSTDTPRDEKPRRTVGRPAPGEDGGSPKPDRPTRVVTEEKPRPSDSEGTSGSYGRSDNDKPATRYIEPPSEDKPAPQRVEPPAEDKPAPRYIEPPAESPSQSDTPDEKPGRRPPVREEDGGSRAYRSITGGGLRAPGLEKPAARPQRSEQLPEPRSRRSDRSETREATKVNPASTSVPRRARRARRRQRRATTSRRPRGSTSVRSRSAGRSRPPGRPTSPGPARRPSATPTRRASSRSRNPPAPGRATTSRARRPVPSNGANLLNGSPRATMAAGAAAEAAAARNRRSNKNHIPTHTKGGRRALFHSPLGYAGVPPALPSFVRAGGTPAHPGTTWSACCILIRVLPPRLRPLSTSRPSRSPISACA